MENNLTIDPAELGDQFTEMFIKSSENVSLLLSLLDVSFFIYLNNKRESV